MNEISRRIDQVISLELIPLLFDAGFKRKSRNFWRECGQVVVSLNVQASQWNRDEEGQFTINVGVYSPVVAQIEGKPVIEGFVSPELCTVGNRIGRFMFDGHDHWWELSSGSDDAYVGRLVASSVSQHILPWFARLESIPELLQESKKFNKPLTTASIALALKDFDEAERVAIDAIKNFPDQYSIISAWAERNNLILRF